MIDLPFEFEFEMHGEKEVKLPLFTGHVARGILLNAIRHVDPATSQKLHEPNLRKAYAVTPLWFRSKARLPDGYVMDPERGGVPSVERWLGAVLEGGDRGADRPVQRDP